MHLKNHKNEEKSSVGVHKLIKQFSRKLSFKNLNAREKKRKELIERGIYKHEPVFGNDLANIPVYWESSNKNNNHPHLNKMNEDGLPEIIVRCITRIEQKMAETGLYRINGDMATVQKIR